MADFLQACLDLISLGKFCLPLLRFDRLCLGAADGLIDRFWRLDLLHFRLCALRRLDLLHWLGRLHSLGKLLFGHRGLHWRLDVFVGLFRVRPQELFLAEAAAGRVSWARVDRLVVPEDLVRVVVVVLRSGAGILERRWRCGALLFRPADGRQWPRRRPARRPLVLLAG